MYDIRNVDHANGMTIYKTSDCLFEDNHIHDIHKGNGINDKDGGHGNEHRGNVIHECPGNLGIMIMGQGIHHDLRLHDNLLYGRQGGFTIGLHPHGVLGTRVHHNTVLSSLHVKQAQHTTVWNCVFQSKEKTVCFVNDKFKAHSADLKPEKEEETVFLARRTVFSSSDPAAFVFGDRWKTNPVGLDAFVRSTRSEGLLSTKVEFENAEKQDYRIKLTPELQSLAGKDDYLGAHERVLKWAAAGCPMRNRDNVAERLGDSKK